eukprot:7384898-Prymnesium_polylepis.1
MATSGSACPAFSRLSESKLTKSSMTARSLGAWRSGERGCHAGLILSLFCRNGVMLSDEWTYVHSLPSCSD